MTNATFDRRLHIDAVGSTEVVLNLHENWLQYRSELDILLPGELFVKDLWTSPVRIETQQILTNGPAFTLLPKGYVARSHWLPVKHAEYGSRCQAARVCLGQHPHRIELFLIPVNAVQGSASKAAFWGYLIHDGTTLLTNTWIEKVQLPVVLDLDETLLVAFTASSLQGEINKLKFSRNLYAEQALAAPTIDARQPLDAKASLVDAEIKSLRNDAVWLEQYTRENAVTFTKGAMRVTETVRYEQAQTDDSLIDRPVVRLPGGVVLTRVDPARPETAMIMRIRPGWDELRPLLAPKRAAGSAPSSRRFDVFVCTAAERGYALEAWRLLDSQNDVIPLKYRPTRIVCVPSGRKKELRRVLGIQAPFPLRTDEAVAAGAPPPSPACAMPLAVIVDDRVDVWEPESEGQVLRVAPFAPHRPVTPGQNQMSHPLQRRAMEEEMGLVKDRLTAVRAHLHKPIRDALTPSVQHFLTSPHPLDTIRTGRHTFPSIPSVPELLRRPGLSIDSLSDAAAQMQLVPGQALLGPQDPHNMHNAPAPAPQPQPQPQPPAASVNLLPVDVRALRGGALHPAAPPPHQPRPTGPGPRPTAGHLQHQPSDPRALQTQLSGPRAGLQQPSQGPGGLEAPPGLHHLALDPRQDPRRARQLHHPVQQQLQQPAQPQASAYQQQSHQHQQAGLAHPVQAAEQQLGSSLANGFAARPEAPREPGPAGGQQQQSGPGLQQPHQPAPVPLSGAVAGLAMHRAQELIRRAVTRPSNTWNPISVLKEAADKQRVSCNFLESQVPVEPNHFAIFKYTVMWHGQEIASAQEHDKKTAKKEAAKRAVDFVLAFKHNEASAQAVQPKPAQASSSGSKGSGGAASPRSAADDKGLIREANALASLNAEFSQQVEWKTSNVSGGFCETVRVEQRQYVVLAVNSNKKQAKRWAGMRLLMELGKPIDPFFFRDTPEGLSAAPLGPSWQEFMAATQVHVFEGQPRPKAWTNHRNGLPRPPLPAQPQKPAQGQGQGQGQGQAEGQGQVQGLKQTQGQGTASKQVLDPGQAPAKRTAAAARQGGQGQKRAARAEAESDAPSAKRAKPAGQVAAKEAAQRAHAAAVRENAARLANDAEPPASPKRMNDIEQNDAASPNNMSMDMSEDSAPIDVSYGSQSGYMQEESPDPDAAAAVSEEDATVDVDKSEPTSRHDGIDTSIAARAMSPPPWRRTQSPKVAKKDVNMLHTDPAYWAAVQQQSKIKEGEWSEVKLVESDGSGNIIKVD